MADYDIVPRALRSLGQTARQVIPLRAQREESKARLGLEEAKTRYDIEAGEEARAQRKATFEAQEREREADIPIKDLAREQARRGLVEMGRQKAQRDEPVTQTWVLKTMGIQDEFDLLSRGPNIQKGLEESFASKLNPQSLVYEKAEGVPLLQGELFDRPDKFNLVDFINRDFVFQAESERDTTTDPERKAYLTKLLASPTGKEKLYRKNLEAFQALQAGYSAIMPPGQQEVLKANIKRVEGKIAELRKFRMEKEVEKPEVDAKYATKRISDIAKAAATLEKTDVITQLIAATNPELLGGMVGQKITKELREDLDRAWQVEIDYLQQFVPKATKEKVTQKRVEPEKPGPIVTHRFIPGKGLVPVE